MPGLIIVGAQWGDEGKGKVVDLYTADADVAVRYGGGPNAGHTVVVGGEKTILHHVPSGVLGGRSLCVLGPGMVVDPGKLLTEIETLTARGHLAPERLLIAEHAHTILPHHVLIDGLREEHGSGIGTTRRGIGPAYEDKAARRGIRLGDLCDRARLLPRLAANLEAWGPVFTALGSTAPAVGPMLDRLLEQGAQLAPRLGDASRAVFEQLRSGRKVIFEGAQGTLLDLDHGTYPFVTSSSAVAGGACTGVGVGPTAIDAVVGVAKAYATRVGGGPLPTEVPGEAGERLREAGAEYGATTGRPRRCGWLDIPALRLAARINGLTAIALTKLDVLSGLDTIPVAVEYEVDGHRLDEIPLDALERARPVYESLPGWQESIGHARSLGDLPPAARAYVSRIEQWTGVPVILVSVGHERDQTIRVQDPFGLRAARP